jgi:ABC-type polysaccharide/polyol phosphate export permease
MLISRLLLFITPVFYKLNYTSPPFRKAIYWGNPITPFMVSFYEIIMNARSFHLFNYLYALVLGLVFFIFGYFIFLTIENNAMERA